MNDYCPYCVSNINSAGDTYDCGSPVGATMAARTRTCLEGEVAVLRAEKEHLTNQNYDLSWQLRQISSAIQDADDNRPNDDLSEEIKQQARLWIPFSERDDDYTREHRERMEALRARYQ